VYAARFLPIPPAAGHWRTADGRKASPLRNHPAIRSHLAAGLHRILHTGAQAGHGGVANPSRRPGIDPNPAGAVYLAYATIAEGNYLEGIA